MTELEKAFIIACTKNDLKFAQIYVNQKVDVHIENDWALEIVIKEGYSDLLLWFLQNIFTHEKAAELGALRYAVHFKNIALIKNLMSFSDYYKKDSGALQWAIDKGNLELIELVLPYVEDLDWSYCIAAKKGYIQVLKYLNDNQIYQYDRNMNLVLNWAIKANKFEAAKLLLDEGIVEYDTLFSDGKVKYELWLKYNNT